MRLKLQWRNVYPALLGITAHIKAHLSHWNVPKIPCLSKEQHFVQFVSEVTCVQTDWIMEHVLRVGTVLTPFLKRVETSVYDLAPKMIFTNDHFKP